MIQRFNWRQHTGARHRVVHEAAREQLAALAVVGAVFAEHLARTLGDAAMDLSVQQCVVEHGAAVIYCDVALYRCVASGGIDLDFGDVRAAREGA